MALFESMLPDTITLTDEQFKTFLEQTIAAEHSRRLLDELTAQNAATATADGHNAAKQKQIQQEQEQAAQTGTGTDERRKGNGFTPPTLALSKTASV